MTITNRFMKRFAQALGVGAFLCVGSLLFGSPHASAAYSCGVNTGDSHSMAGLVVDVKWIPAGGTTSSARDDNGSNVVITTNSPSSTKDGSGNPANIAKMSSDGATELATVHTRTFQQVNANCSGKGYVAVLGYGQTSPDTASGYDYWALDCDVSKHPDHYQSFHITGTGVPSGARAGGTWTYINTDQNNQGQNGYTTTVTIYYKEPLDWTLSGTSTVKSANSARATNINADQGQSVTFFHNVKNAGPSTATYQWKMQKNYAGAGWSDGTSLSSNVSAAKNAGNPNPATGSGAPYTITIPANAAVGSKYCQRVYYTDATGPGTAAATSAQSCVTVTAASSITVNMSCNQSNYVLTGTANDKDYAGPYKVKFYKDSVSASNQINTGITSTGSNGTYSVNVSSFMSDGLTHTFFIVATGKDATGADTPSGTAQASDDCVPPPCTPGSPGCGPGGGSGPDCAGQNTTPTVYLSPIAPSTPTPTSYNPPYSRTPNATYEQDTPQNNYRIDSASDSQDGYYATTSINWTPDNRPGYNTNSNAFRLDYTNYVNNYPYDHHDTRVTYSQQYTKTIWTSASSPSGYTCDYGGNLSGSTCSYDYSATPDHWYCDNGDSGGGWYNSTCTHTWTGYAAYWSCNNGDSGGGYSQTCTRSDGTTYNGTTSWYWCQGTHNGGYWSQTDSCSENYTGTADYYYCSSPPYGNAPGGSTTGGNSSSSCNYSYPGNPYYNWNAGPDQPNQDQTGGVYDYPVRLNECYERTFTAHDPTASVNITPDNESPNTANFQATIQVDFGYPSNAPAKQLLNRNQVTLSYTANYYYVPAGSAGDPADGQPLPCSASTSGTIYISDGYAASTNNPGSAFTSCTNNPSFIPPVEVGGRICAHFAISPTGDTINENGTIVSNNGQSVEAHGCSSPLVNEPYAHFFGSEVWAGGSYNGAGGCGVATAGGINTYLRSGTDPRPRGSAVQLGALAIGPINSFSSASMRTGAPTAYTGLTFANSGVGGMGGSLGGNHCVPDFYGSAPSTATPGGNINSLGSSPSGAYSFTGPQTLNALTIDAGTNQAAFVNGDVYITGNITLDQSNWTIDANGKTNIPSFYLVVNGNIWIDPGVTQLDGMYIAQGSGSSGTINTCATAFAPFNATSLYDSCNVQLTVNGGFIANTVKFRRAFSSLRHTDFGENPNTGFAAHNCAISGGSSTDPRPECAAEIFNFSPETYLSQPAFTPSSGANTGKYDYIKSLSPVL